MRRRLKVDSPSEYMDMEDESFKGHLYVHALSISPCAREYCMVRYEFVRSVFISTDLDSTINILTKTDSLGLELNEDQFNLAPGFSMCFSDDFAGGGD